MAENGYERAICSQITEYRTHPRKRPGARVVKYLKSGEERLRKWGGGALSNIRVSGALITKTQPN